MHRFVDAQALDVGKADAGRARGQHRFRVVVALKRNEPGFAVGSCQDKQLAQGEADPRHRDRPRLHAAVTVNALLQRSDLHDRSQIQRLRLVSTSSLDAHRPWVGNMPLGGVVRRVLFAGAKFVEIVVAGDGGEWSLLVCDVKLGWRFDGVEFGWRGGGGVGSRKGANSGGGCDQETPTVEIHLFGCDIGIGSSACLRIIIWAPSVVI